MKRRTHHRKTHHRKGKRRHSVAGVKGVTGTLMNAVYVVGGVAVAGFVVNKFLASQSETIKTIAPVVLGVGLPMIIKSDLGKFAGLGMIAYSGSKLLSKAGLGSLGAETYEIPVTVAGDMSLVAGGDDFAMAGDGDSDFAMGYDDISVVAGMYEEA